MAWVEKDHNDHLVSTPLPWAGSLTARSGCPEPHPAWPQTPAGMGHPQPPWATCSVRHHPPGEKLPPKDDEEHSGERYGMLLLYKT